MLLSLAEKCCVSSDVNQTARNTHFTSSKYGATFASALNSTKYVK